MKKTSGLIIVNHKFQYFGSFKTSDSVMGWILFYRPRNNNHVRLTLPKHMFFVLCGGQWTALKDEVTDCVIMESMWYGVKLGALSLTGVSEI